MPDVTTMFASTTAIFTTALTALVTNYLVVVASIIGVSLAFYFLWKIVAKGKRAVH